MHNTRNTTDRFDLELLFTPESIPSLKYINYKLYCLGMNILDRFSAKPHPGHCVRSSEHFFFIGAKVHRDRLFTTYVPSRFYILIYPKNNPKKEIEPIYIETFFWYVTFYDEAYIIGKCNKSKNEDIIISNDIKVILDFIDLIIYN